MQNKYKTHLYKRYLIFAVIGLLIFSPAYGAKANAVSCGDEFLGAVIGDVLLGISSGLLVTLISQGPHANLGDMGPGISFAGSAYIIGGSIGAPLGTVLSGEKNNQKSSVLNAYMGGIMGTGLGLIIFKYTDSKIPSNIGIPVFLLLPPLCSVIGYNISTQKDNSHSMFNRNIPQIGVTVLPENHNNKISAKIGMNVVYRF